MPNNNCPGCGRPIDPGDDEIVSKPGPFGQEEWHEECSLNPPQAQEVEEVEVEDIEVAKVEPLPETPIEAPPQPEPLVKEKKVPKKKKLTQDQVNEILIKEVQRLTDIVAKMQAAPPKEVATPAAKKKSTKGQPRPDAWYVIRGFPTEKYPPQCMRVMRCLAQAAPEGGRMSEVEVFNALMGPDTTIGPWPYRQDAFYIFRYYKCPMLDGNYLLGPYFVG